MTTPQQNKDLFAILMICFGYFGYSLSDALTKWVITDISAPQVTVITHGIAVILLLGLILGRHGIKGFKVTQIKLHSLRTLCILPMPFLVLHALEYLPLTEFYSVIFMTPLMLIIASFIFLKEPFERTKVTMTCIGFLGVLIVIQGQFAQQWIGFLYTFLAVICATGQTIILRKMRPETSRLAFAFYPSLAMIIVYMPFALTSYTLPTDFQWIILMGIGLCALCGQIGCIIGYQSASTTSTVTSFHYTQMIWGIALGYLIFEHIPSTSTFIGAVLIIYAGLHVALFTREATETT